MGRPGLDTLKALGYDLPTNLDQYPLDDLIKVRHELKKLQKLLFDQKTGFDREVGDEIVQRMCAGGETERLVDDLVAKLRDGTTPSQLSETRLLEAGVSADIIASSREKGTSYVYVEIKRSTSTK